MGQNAREVCEGKRVGGRRKREISKASRAHRARARAFALTTRVNISAAQLPHYFDAD